MLDKIKRKRLSQPNLCSYKISYGGLIITATLTPYKMLVFSFRRNRQQFFKAYHFGENYIDAKGNQGHKDFDTARLKVKFYSI